MYGTRVEEVDKIWYSGGYGSEGAYAVQTMQYSAREPDFSLIERMRVEGCKRWR
jgi:hypothetical protein